MPFASRESADMLVSTLNVFLASALLVGHLGTAQEVCILKVTKLLLSSFSLQTVPLGRQEKKSDEATRTIQVCLHVKVDRTGSIMIPQDIVDYLHQIARLRGLMGPENQKKRNDHDDNLRLYKKRTQHDDVIRLYKRGIRLYKKRGIRLY